ncbi:MAG: aminoglycoside phosphotransferase family protein [bacterium]|nr:aminoglycoside phosphotransferase family protein [bacterium]
MNKILALFQEEEVRALLEHEVLPLYPEFTKIVSVAVKPYKRLVWETTYHVVISYRVVFLKTDGSEEKIQIICSAHSEEPRIQAYQVLRFLWDSGLSGNGVILPQPLFYSEYYQGFFYRAVEGNNLLHYIKENNREAVALNTERAAQILARLHALPLPDDTSIFSDNNRSLVSVVPGSEVVIREIRARFNGEYADDLASFYQRFITQEDNYFSTSNERWLIHGDAHPENFIAVGDNRIGMIDFTDFCPADFARDLGAFMQQIEYKIGNYLQDQDFAREMKRLFLEAYLKESGRDLDESLQSRIDLYYNFTTIRTAGFYLMKFNCDTAKAEVLIKKVKENFHNNFHAQN